MKFSEGAVTLHRYCLSQNDDFDMKGDPNAEKGSIDRQNYEEGLRMGSLGLFTQNGMLISAMKTTTYH